MGRILTEQEKETFIANRDRLLDELNELQADFEDLSNEDLIELRDVMLDRINICLKAILEDEKDYDIDVEANTNDIDQIKNQAIDEFTRYMADLIDDNEYGFVGKLLDTPYTTMLEVAQDFKNGVDKEDVDLDR